VSYELPHLGKFAWENAVANPATGAKTVVMGMDDSPGGQVYVYVGEKRVSGNPVERAGLVGGQLHALKVQGDRFSLFNFGDVSAMNGDELEKAGRDNGVANFMRPEDGAWDIKNPNTFYFATTDKIDGTSQLFQLRFDDVSQPEKGGVIQVVLNARDIGAQMFDNLTVGSDGKLLVEEDPGDNPHMASIWQFDPATKVAKKILAVSPESFMNKNSGQFLTQDEENSGVIEITELLKEAKWFDVKRRYYLGSIQIHAKSSDPELVEDGQLYLITSPAL
jgi:secreted PhoX family phosphatase